MMALPGASSRHRSQRWATIVFPVFLLVLVMAGPALAHGDLESAEPEADSTVRKAPEEVVLTLTEPPGPGTSVTVHDGCVRDVVVDLSQSSSEVRARLKDGQPGNWHVRYRTVSSVDGHTVRGTYSFFVKGKHDCSQPKESPADDAEIAGGEDTRIRPEDEGASGFPLIPFTIGSVVVIGIALVLRRAATR